MANMKWSDVADKNITMQMEFWMNVTRDSDCKISKVKALVSMIILMIPWDAVNFFSFNNTQYP